MKPYKKRNIPLAKELRKNMTPWERKLWYEYLRFYPVRFQRQKAIGDYIADFYCAKAQLIIELDGGGHYEASQLQKDAVRTDSLKETGLRVLRICNLDIDNNFRGVCEHIDHNVQNSLPQSASPTAPSSEGALECAKTVYALGFFDGVHLGHQALLRACVELAKELDVETAAITFQQHPQTLFSNQTPPLLSTLSDRFRLLLHYDMYHIDPLPVTEEVMSTRWQGFLDQLMEWGAAGFVCGEDFRFGDRGEGNAEKLQEYCAERGLPCVIIPEQTMDGERISSSRIRSLLENGEVEKANRLLGHPHILTGEVVAGRQLGRTIGIPTANLLLPEGLVQPKFGVYACLARVDGKAYPAVTNIGTRPTVDGQGVTVEPWLLDFEGDLYGKEITLEFHAFLRPEKKFPDLESLRQEILKNGAQTRKIFEKS